MMRTLSLVSRKQLLTSVGLLGLTTTPVLAEGSEERHAYRLGLGYTGEIWRAAEGGRDTGSAYLDNLDLTLEVDGAGAFDQPGLTLYAHALYNNGRSIGSLVGDAQGVSNIEAVETLRLFEFWGDWELGAKRNHSLLFGLYALDSEFDVTPSAGLFIGASHGTGAELAQTGENGPSIFPVTSLALRYQWRISEHWRLRAAVLDGVPGAPDNPKRTTIRFDDGDGALMIAETSYRAGALTKAAFGIWRYTGDFDNLATAESGIETRRRQDNHGIYGLADVALLENPGSAAPKLSAFLRYGIADGDINRFDRYLGTGLVLRNVLSPDSHDELGLGFSRAHNGDGYRELATQQGRNVQSAETNIELTWHIPVNDWLSVQPAVQYIIDPDTDPELDNALVLGLRFQLSLDKRW